MNAIGQRQDKISPVITINHLPPARLNPNWNITSLSGRLKERKLLARKMSWLQPSDVLVRRTIVAGIWSVCFVRRSMSIFRVLTLDKIACPPTGWAGRSFVHSTSAASTLAVWSVVYNAAIIMSRRVSPVPCRPVHRIL